MNALLALWLAAHSADATTTHLALSRGGIERNPFYTQSPWTNDAIMAGEAVGMTLLAKKLAPSHPRWTKAAVVGGIALSGYAAMHNVQTLRAMR
jgi:hypothetical protein